MVFDESEFKKMRFNIRRLGEDQEVLFKFPDLMIYKDVFLANNMGSGLDPDFVLRYLIYLFDPGSPAQNIPDLKKRKAYVMTLLGRDLSSLTSFEHKMMCWNNKGVNTRAVVLLLIYGPEKYLVWKRLQEKLFQLSERQIELDGADINEKKKQAETEKLYSELISSCVSEMEVVKVGFLNGEVDGGLPHDLTQFTLADSLGIRPEEYVRSFEMRGDVFDKEDILP